MDTVITNWKKNFFTIWTGQAISQFSSSVLQFAVVWYLTDHTGSAMVLTAAMMMGFLPQGVLGPFIGVFIDRYNRKRIMIISDLLISAASFVMVLAGWMGRLSTELILVVCWHARSVPRSTIHAFSSYPADCPGRPVDQMCGIFAGVGISITNLKPGCRGGAVQFLEPERNYLLGRHRGADCGNYAWNHANPGIAAGGT